MPINQIAKHTRVPFETVRRHHERVSASVPVGQIATPTSSPAPNRPTYAPKPAERTVTRGGSTYTMNTAGIGRAPEPVTTLQAIGYRGAMLRTVGPDKRREATRP